MLLELLLLLQKGSPSFWEHIIERSFYYSSIYFFIAMAYGSKGSSLYFVRKWWVDGDAARPGIVLA